MKNKEKPYLLRLSNGQTWQLFGSNGTKTWLAEFARILEIKKSSAENSQKIIFIPADRKNKDQKTPILPEELNLPKRGWKLEPKGSAQVWKNNKIKTAVCELKLLKNKTLRITSMMQALKIVFQEVVKKGGFPFHSALLEKDGNAILISAPGSTGKSTCSRRVPPPWTAHCDDATLILKNTSGKYCVHPFPTWSDYLVRKSKKTWRVKNSYPLKAIFFIEQAKYDKVIPIWSGQATILINQQITHTNRTRDLNKREEEKNRKLKNFIFKNACELASNIPVFILKVKKSGKFWLEIEKALSEHKTPMAKPIHDNSIKLYTPKLLAKSRRKRQREKILA
ncbi:MAG: SynChlorMet cassette protein ScmC [Candidatus Saganbacteria bacterium]|nr:SynChlorMet cassette protein ScmC [Candidatus Saganbacteria bacterium]